MNTSLSRNSDSDFPPPHTVYAASRAIPHAPPSPAVFITETAQPSPSARNCCATPFVLNRPPCPVIFSTETCSFSKSISIPSFSAAIVEYISARNRFARLNFPSGVRKYIGLPFSAPATGSPERKLYTTVLPQSGSPVSA